MPEAKKRAATAKADADDVTLIETFTDVLRFMEKHGIAKDDAAVIATTLFQWGVTAAADANRAQARKDGAHLTRLPTI